MLAGKRANWGHTASWLIKGIAGRSRALLFSSDFGERRPLTPTAVTGTVRNTYGYACGCGHVQNKNTSDSHTQLPVDINSRRRFVHVHRRRRSDLAIVSFCLTYCFTAADLLLFFLHGRKRLSRVFAQYQNDCGWKSCAFLITAPLARPLTPGSLECLMQSALPG